MRKQIVGKFAKEICMNDVERLLEVAKERKALMFGEFQLSAGGTSSYYFDGRILTLDPEGSFLVAKCLFPILVQNKVEAIAGPTLGADPIVSTVSLYSYLQNNPIKGLIVRKEAKAHGGRRSIEGAYEPGMKVAVVDDTCTSGSSLFHAIDVVESLGCDVVKVLSVLDRKAGGSDELANRGYQFESLLTADGSGNISTM